MKAVWELTWKLGGPGGKTCEQLMCHHSTTRGRAHSTAILFMGSLILDQHFFKQKKHTTNALVEKNLSLKRSIILPSVMSLSFNNKGKSKLLHWSSKCSFQPHSPQSHVMFVFVTSRLHSLIPQMNHKLSVSILFRYFPNNIYTDKTVIDIKE